MKPVRVRAMWVALTMWMGLSAACSQQAPSQPQNQTDEPDATEQPDFVSADVRGVNNAEHEPLNNGTGGGPATTDELYRAPSSLFVSDGERLALNLSPDRGLQVIDVSDPDAPELVSEVRLAGTPIALERVGSLAVVVFNGVISGLVERPRGPDASGQAGHVLLVDLSNADEPRVLGHVQLEGTAQVARLDRGTDPSTLVVAACVWEDGAGYRCTASALSAGGDGLVQTSRVALGEGLARVVAAGDVLVAQPYVAPVPARSAVKVVALSAASGELTAEGRLEIEGELISLDAIGSRLRVLSGGARQGDCPASEQLQLFDVADPVAPRLVKAASRCAPARTTRSIYVDNGVFLVDGSCTESLVFVDSTEGALGAERATGVPVCERDGLALVAGDSRLIALRARPTDGQVLEVRLFDVDAPEGTDPLLDQEEVAAPQAADAEPWPHGVLTVMEDAVSAVGDGGELETGLVAVPYLGGEVASGLQLLTFSAQSVTARDPMPHLPLVRGPVAMGGGLFANVSPAEVSLWDLSEGLPGRARGEVDVAVDVTGFFVFGDRGVRRNSRRHGQSSFAPVHGAEDALFEVVPLSANTDIVVAEDTFPMSANAEAVQVGHLLVGVDATPVWGGAGELTFDTTIRVFDLSAPSRPRKAGRMTTGELRFDTVDWESGLPGTDGQRINAVAVGDTIVFPRRVPFEVPVESTKVWCTTVVDPVSTDVRRFDGEITCLRDGDAPPVCSGVIEACVETPDDPETSWSCEPIDPTTVPTRETCRSETRVRRSVHYAFDVLDLSDPDAPSVSAHLTMSPEDEAAGLINADGTLYISTKRVASGAGAAGPTVRYFFRTLDTRDPRAPVLSEPVNIPGSLVAVRGEALFSWDAQWTAEGWRSLLRRSSWSGGVARLEASWDVGDEVLNKVVEDDGRLYAFHTSSRPWSPGQWPEQRLTVLGEDLAELGVVERGSPAAMLDVKAGRVVFQVAGGLEVLNCTDPARPVTEGVFATDGSADAVTLASEALYLTGGRSGLHKVALDLTAVDHP